MAAMLAVGLASCSTVPEALPAPEVRDSPWITQRFTTTDPAVPATVTVFDPPPEPARTHIVRDVSAGDGAFYLGTTPWRRSLTGRQPVGVVMSSGTVQAVPVPSYWAVVLRNDGGWEIVPQRAIVTNSGDVQDGEIVLQPGRAPSVTPNDVHLAVGGFYPLVVEGRAVARQFPGGDIRAPRVAIGGTDRRLVVVTAGVGAGGGLTTEELAQELLRFDLDWALNLDGGRSAYLRLPGGEVYPRGIWFRRRGPVALRFLPPRAPEMEMVE
ncbi:MAG: phosphodiester glycosidase family protein [Alkalispirochaeta sp.]